MSNSCAQFVRLLSFSLALAAPCLGSAQTRPLEHGSRVAIPILRCREAVVEAELNAGKPFERAFGGGLKLYAQPIAAGWILRVLPVSGPAGDHDYAELATPPYRSPSPLSLSTDFAFRAQDAIAWNPRRFRFATTPESFAILSAAYTRLMDAGPVPPAAVQAELAHQVAQAAEGTLTILDATLVVGTADQSRLAAPMAQHFDQTPHTFADVPAGKATALGALLAARVRITLELPLDFPLAGAAPDVKLLPHACVQSTL